MREVASWLRSLAVNKQHVIDIIIGELSDPTNFQVHRRGQSQTFMLHRGEGYSLRLMLWAPSEDRVSAPFSYGYVHDHDFDLMSVGFWGPGYRTSLYRFDYDEPAQNNQGLALLSYDGETRLGEGEVMYYFASLDVHQQHPPESLSVSLNLLITRPDVRLRQTVFDLEGPPVNGVVKGRSRFNSLRKLSAQHSMFSALAGLENADSLDIVLKIAKEHSSDEVRALAWGALFNRAEPQPGWYQECRHDASDYVRNILGNFSPPRGEGENQ